MSNIGENVEQQKLLHHWWGQNLSLLASVQEGEKVPTLASIHSTPYIEGTSLKSHVYTQRSLYKMLIAALFVTAR